MNVQIFHGTKFRRLLVLAAACVAGSQVHCAAAADLPSPVVAGRWTTQTGRMPINPVHLAMLHTGKVLIVAGSEANKEEHENGEYYAALWDPVADPQAANIHELRLTADIFCNGSAFLPDGRLLIVGGTAEYNPFYGESRATIFDPATEMFMQVESMAHGRWYANATALSDGRVMTFSGISTGQANRAVEIYTVGSGWSPEAVANWGSPSYPWAHVLHDGRVFFSGPGWQSHIFDPLKQAWAASARTLFGVSKQRAPRSAGTSVLLPLLPEKNYAERIVLMGGGVPPTADAEIIDLTEKPPAWRALPALAHEKRFLSAVMLPTGKVLQVGGGVSTLAPVLNSQLFDPDTKTWSPGADIAYQRLYHSGAILLPDARVWLVGSNRVQETGAFENRMEIYEPSYLYAYDNSGQVVHAKRPVIADAPPVFGYQADTRELTIHSPDAADIKSVVLVRASTVTHANNMEQRLVGLQFHVGGGGKSLVFAPPPRPGIAPPGYYMLFIINNAGVPSVAAFVQVSARPQNLLPKATIVTPASDMIIHAGESITFNGAASDPTGQMLVTKWLFPTGEPNESTSLHPPPVKFGSPGKYVISLTAVDAVGGNDPSPPTRTITVLFPGP